MGMNMVTIASEKILDKLADETTGRHIASVSYTHLDVYKRQHYIFKYKCNNDNVYRNKSYVQTDI